jgi:hypothetical protein
MLAWIGTFFAVAATLPQLLHTLQTWKLEDLNGTSIVLAFLSNATFFIYSYGRREWAYVALTAWFMLYGCILMYVKSTSGSRDSLRE